jgi:uncharacterized protein (TIGR03435 family)
MAGVTLDDFSTRLDQVLDRPVVNRTEIAGLFDIRLDFARQGTTLAASPTGGVLESDTPSIFTAIQQQLGLRLEATKGPIEVLIIDHAEKPSEN